MRPRCADLQVNGFMGVDFSDARLSADGFRRAAEALFEAGTDLFLPTIVTSPREVYRRNVDLIERTVDREGWRDRVPGVHLEGPFLTPVDGAIGCHNTDWVRLPDPAFLDELRDFIRLLTIAPERPGATDLVRHATARGIVVSAGHCLPSPDDLAAFAAAGGRLLTHLGNGCPQLLDRHRNPVLAGLACDDLTAMIITDGHHLPPELIKVVLRCKGPDRVIVTSDAAPIAGLPPGRYRQFGGDEVVLEPSGRISCPRTGQLAASSATAARCRAYLESLDLLAEEELDAVCWRNPLRIIGVEP